MSAEACPSLAAGDAPPPEPQAEPEERFEDREIFFSRTDPTGIIRSGNRVFERVSGYDWNRLIGAPHKIVRHPDTPRAVFHLLWREISAGRPIGAYVKNRSRTGGFYWVLAIVTPVDGGCLSVRIRPEGAFFDQARALYAELRGLERGDGTTPALSCLDLEARLQGLGFRRYAAFMSAALGQEVIGRDARLGRVPDAALLRLSMLSGTARAIVDQARAIQAASADSRRLPLNLQVQAARRGAHGVTIASIAGNYRAIVEDLAACLDAFETSAHAVEDAVGEAVFLLAAAKVQAEMAQGFDAETAAGRGDGTPAHDVDAVLLARQAQLYRRKALSGVEAIAPRILRFQVACADMKRLAAALEVTRVVGKVESARLVDTGDGLQGLIEDLGVFQRTLSEGLAALGRDSQKVAHGVAAVMRDAGDDRPDF